MKALLLSLAALVLLATTACDPAAVEEYLDTSPKLAVAKFVKPGSDYITTEHCSDVYHVLQMGPFIIGKDLKEYGPRGAIAGNCVIHTPHYQPGARTGPFTNPKVEDIGTVQYQPFKVNQATFMFPGIYGDVFITDELGGCDIWIGMCADTPFIIHSNGNELEDPVQNLMYKNKLARCTIQETEKMWPKCHFVHRISFDYGNPEELNSEMINHAQKVEIDKYWSDFEDANPGIQISTYYGVALFYGIRNGRQNENTVKYGDWVFKLRDTNSRSFFRIARQ